MYVETCAYTFANVLSRFLFSCKMLDCYIVMSVEKFQEKHKSYDLTFKLKEVEAARKSQYHK